jgi:hypothetical protein
VGYSPDDDFDTTFGVDNYRRDITLMQAALVRPGHRNRVARFGVAALLNATHPDIDFALSPEEVMELVRDGDLQALRDLVAKDHFCPLN